jgi:Transposase DDE domain group 1
MTRLSCHRFRANEVRLQLSVLAYTLRNLWRRLVLPNRIDRWSLTSLQQRLVKTGGRLIKHARHYWLLLGRLRNGVGKRLSGRAAYPWAGQNWLFGAAQGQPEKKIGLQLPSQRRPDVYFQLSAKPKRKSWLRSHDPENPLQIVRFSARGS